jgi:citrate lyase subunit alpha/citrate CoA-transferase
VVPIDQLRERAEHRTGGPFQLRERDLSRVVAVVEYRDGTVIDVIRQVEGGGASTSADMLSDTDKRLSSA